MRDLSESDLRRLVGEPCREMWRARCPFPVLVRDGTRTKVVNEWCLSCRARRELARRERERGRK